MNFNFIPFSGKFNVAAERTIRIVTLVPYTAQAPNVSEMYVISATFKTTQSQFLIRVLCLVCVSKYLPNVVAIVQIPVAARSKAYICGRSPSEIAGSNPTEGVDVCLL
jgi:hypothetical protein